MAKIIFTRIDDRLLHGQVARSWVKEEGADLIVVANDRVAGDEEAQKLMNISTPMFVDTVFLTIEDTIKNLEDKYEGKQAMVLVENTEDAYKLSNSNLDIRFINVGNMRELPGTSKINDYIYISSEDKEILKKLLEKGIGLDIRVRSSDNPIEPSNLF